MMNGNGDIDMATAVPYYVSYPFSVSAGAPADSPNQQVYFAPGTDASDLSSLLVNQDVQFEIPAAPAAIG